MKPSGIFGAEYFTFLVRSVCLDNGWISLSGLCPDCISSRLHSLSARTDFGSEPRALGKRPERNLKEERVYPIGRRRDAWNQKSSLSNSNLSEDLMRDAVLFKAEEAEQIYQQEVLGERRVHAPLTLPIPALKTWSNLSLVYISGICCLNPGFI